MVTVKKYSLRFLILLLSFTVVLIVVLAVRYDSVDLRLRMDEAEGLETSWKYVQEETVTELSLPIHLEGVEGNEWEIYNQLPVKLSDDDYLCLRASNQELKVYVDGEVIYQRLTGEDTYIGRVIWGNWNLVPLKAEYAGKEIRVAYSTPYQEYQGFVNDITYGSKNENLYSIIKENALNFVISLIMLLVGIMLLIIGILMKIKKVPERSMIYLALFTILFAMWMMGETKMLQFVTGNPVLATTMHFWGFLLFPIPLLLFVGESYESHHPQIVPALFVGFVANFIVTASLQLFKIYDFLTTIWTTHVMCVLTILFLLADLLMEIIKYQNKRASRLLKAFCIFFGLALFQIASFYLEDIVTLSVTRYMGIGYLVIIIYISVDILLRMQEILESRKEREYFEKLAYTDLLTDSRNRSAYIRDMDHYFAVIKK